MSIGIEEPSVDLKREVVKNFIGEGTLPAGVVDQLVRKGGLNLKKIETIIKELQTYQRLGEKIDDTLLNKVLNAFID